MAAKPGKPPERKRTLRPESVARGSSKKSSSPPARVARPTRPPPLPASAARPTRPPPLPASPPRAAPARSGSLGDGSSPEITLQRTQVGRSTLAAIVDELAGDATTAIRPKLDTIGYEERPAAPASSRPPGGSSPEVITIGHAPIGRATQAAIEEALAAEVLAIPVAAPIATPGAVAPRGALQPAEIFEISTFVVEGAEIFTKASEASRRDFVESRLIHRLPALSMNEVVRIDVTRGAAPETVVLRVWSRVRMPPAR